MVARPVIISGRYSSAWLSMASAHFSGLPGTHRDNRQHVNSHLIEQLPVRDVMFCTAMNRFIITLGLNMPGSQ